MIIANVLEGRREICVHWNHQILKFIYISLYCLVIANCTTVSRTRTGKSARRLEFGFAKLLLRIAQELLQNLLFPNIRNYHRDMIILLHDIILVVILVTDGTT